MPHVFRRILPYLPVGLFCAAIAIAISQGEPHPLDDHWFYQSFIDSLARGTLDLSIDGFHGSDFFAVPVTWITGSAISQILTLMLWAVLLPLLAFLAGRTVFESDEDGFLFSAIITMMPLLWVGLFRGWTGAGYWGLMLLSLALVKRVPWLSGLALGFAILTKPFAIGLLPLLWVLSKNTSSRSRRSWLIPGIAGALVCIYIAVQYLQAGRIIVGVHPDLGVTNAFQGPVRIVLNLAHAFQIFFSVHNYFFPDPSLTGPANMLHTTPVITFLGLWALTDLGGKWCLYSVRNALIVGLVIAIGLNVPLDHMDHYYLEAAVLLFTLAAFPILRARTFWLALVFATLHFQWLYAFLQFREVFALDYSFFVVPVVVDLLLAAFIVHRWFRPKSS